MLGDSVPILRGLCFVIQVESLSRQLQNQEKENQRSAQQLQNAISMATDEAAKSRAAKEVIKSLTAQVRVLVCVWETLACNFTGVIIYSPGVLLILKLTAF